MSYMPGKLESDPQFPSSTARPPTDDSFDEREERMPRHIDPLRTNVPSQRDMTDVRRPSNSGQPAPTPTRTSIDSTGNGRRRGSNGGGRRSGGGGRAPGPNGLRTTYSR